MKHQSELKVTQADLGLINHLFAFEGAEPLSEQLVRKLICQGWSQSIFQELQNSNFLPRCEHGLPIVYYSEKRNSLLVPVVQTELPTTLEIEKNLTKHFHSLPPGLLRSYQ